MNCSTMICPGCEGKGRVIMTDGMDLGECPVCKGTGMMELNDELESEGEHNER